MGLNYVVAEKDPLPCSDSCFASCPTWTSRFLIEASVFFWFTMDICIKCVKVSSIFDIIFGWACCCCGPVFEKTPIRVVRRTYKRSVGGTRILWSPAIRLIWTWATSIALVASLKVSLRFSLVLQIMGLLFLLSITRCWTVAILMVTTTEITTQNFLNLVSLMCFMWSTLVILLRNLAYLFS